MSEPEDADTEREPTLDEIGAWSIRKHDLVAYYASVYAQITANAKSVNFSRVYIDAFANRGYGRRKDTGEKVKGSALRILEVTPPFDRYVFVEDDKERFDDLCGAVGSHANVQLIRGDANDVLPITVFPSVQYHRRERALCFLDPYNLRGLKWVTMCAAGQNAAVDAIIHFPTMDTHRTVLMRDPKRIRPKMAAKMTAYWGDESWREASYSTNGMLPMAGLTDRKHDTKTVIDAFRKRLCDVAGFVHVTNGIPMKNDEGNPVYHLLLATHNDTAARVMNSVEKRFRD